MITRSRNCFLFFIAFVLCSLTSRAQQNFRVLHWGIEEKMSVSPAIGMIKDIHGFLWIGTGGGGLLRFDGTVFKNYRYELSKKTASVADDIRGLIEDSLHNIWIGTENGLCRYDINADTFKLVALATKTPAGRAIVPFWSTKDEVFCWDYPQSQWAAIDIHTFNKRPLAKMAAVDFGNWLADRFSVFDTASNSLWIEKDSGASFNGGLLQVSLSTGKKQSFSWPCYRNISNHDHSFQSMRYDRNRNAIWINSNDGLVEFTLSDKTFHHIAAMDPLVRQKNYEARIGINIDNQGRIWMGTFPEGIIIYDPTTASLHLPCPGDTALQNKISVDNLMIYCDRDAMVWSGSFNGQNGIYQLIPYSPVATHYVSKPGNTNSLSNDFSVFCADAGKGKIWIGTGDGLNILDTKTGLFQVLRQNDLPGLKSGSPDIQPICIDTATQKAVIYSVSYYLMDMPSKQCIPLIFKDSNGQEVINQRSFPRPFKNGLVLAFDKGNRTLVFIINPDSPVAKQVLSFPAGTINIFETACDDGHLLFLSHGDSGTNLSYAVKNQKWTRTHTPLDSLEWANISFNKTDQTYWVNAKDSLLHLSKDFELIRAYSQKDGLPDGERSRAIQDNYGNTWFAADNLIYRLDNLTGRISALTEKDGFQPNGVFPGLMFSKSADGDLYLSSGISGKGVTRIIPGKYTNTASTVYIQSLLVNQQPYYFVPGIKNEPELNLSYFENRFTIEPGIIDFNSGGKNKFRYKLGESADWIYPYNNIIYYDNLAPGNYDLIMQASNTNNFTTLPTTLHIHISPPWWQTWWAYTLFAIVIASLLWSFILYRSRALRAKNIQLEEKVLHRTKELKHSLEELRETQAQLIQREKMASLGELTAGIAHEIQNPLNFVNNFSDLNAELLEEMKTEIKSGNPDDAITIANDIIANERKINHHGKRADAIVKGMLQHSQSSSGQKEPTGINDLIDEYLRLWYQGYRAKEKTSGINLVTDFDTSIGSINIIPQDIGRVLLNLYNNAFYAVTEKKNLRPEGYQPTVLISTKKIDGKIEIKIKDNGSGIPKQVIDKIFQPFFTTKPTGQGTGLGLSLSYDIIKAHGGTITVESQAGEGATFFIQLPG